MFVDSSISKLFNKIDHSSTQRGDSQISIEIILQELAILTSILQTISIAKNEQLFVLVASLETIWRVNLL
jgi:hypothetical protein